MKVTVAICTRNRSRSLRQTLSRLQQMVIPADVDWELLVVDNHSKDETAEVIKSFADQCPIHYLFEPIVGHSRSRNLAISHANGDLILWTDDDVLVPVNWLQRYVEAAREHPAAAFFGSKIIPEFEQPPPAWIVDSWDKCHPAFATRDLGNDSFQFLPGQYPFGANFAVRGEVQKQFLFDVGLGRNDDAVVGDDEINLLQRISAAGHVGIWLPDAPVQHMIPPQRATANYISKYFVGQGIANVLKDQATVTPASRTFFIFAHNRLCYWLKRHYTKPEEWVSHLIRSSIALGEMRGWKMRKKVKASPRNSARPASAPMRIAFVTDVPYWHQQTGAQQRIARLIDHLKGEQFRIETLFLGHRDPTASNVISLIDEWVPSGWWDWLRWQTKCFFNAVCVRFRRWSVRNQSQNASVNQSRRLKDFHSSEFKHRFKQWIDQHRPDVVIVEYVTLSYLVPHYPRPTSPVYWIDTHDVLSARCQQFKQQGWHHWIDIDLDQERQCLQKFDAVIAIQPDEAETFRELLGERAQIVIAGHAVDPAAISLTDRTTSQDSQKKMGNGDSEEDANCGEPAYIRLGVLASDNAANRDGLKWFLREVWPEVIKKCQKQVQFLVGGGIDSTFLDTIAHHENVVRIGRLDEVRMFYEQVDIVVNPTLFGTGLKIKNIEAFGFGKPLVMTRHAASGFIDLKVQSHIDCQKAKIEMDCGIEKSKEPIEGDPEEQPDCEFPLIAESAQAMAESLIRLIENSDYRQRIASETRKFNDKHLTPDQVYDTLTQNLKSVCGISS